jgi:hypothetical protein
MREEKKGGRGCLFYGCITAVVLAVAAIIAVFFAYSYGRDKYKELVAEYTSSEPAALPQIEMTAEQMQAVRARIDRFGETLNQGERAELILTADELNALIATDPEFADVRGKLYVTLEGDRIKSRVSFPLDDSQLESLKGRYLNGTADLQAGLRNGELIVKIDTIEVNGKKLPMQLMNLIRQENLADQFASSPASKRTIQKLEHVEVQDGRLLIRSKSGTRE